ncbi:MAG: DUF1549 domain-containing protein [Rubripirellula sp.]
MLGWWILVAAVLPVEVDPSVDFDNDIMPILTKAGCNTGACHGAAVGRGGFNLSLYGGNPDADYRSIVLELEGRRVNLVNPDESLVLLKPSEAMEHGGGYRIDPASESARRLVAWIRGGADRRASQEPGPTLRRLEVTPASVVVDADDQVLRLAAIAHFSDGTSRDVTPWTVFTPEDTSALTIDVDTAETKVLRRGRHVVIARYLSEVVPIEVIRPLSDEPIVDSGNVHATNSIDRGIDQVLSTLRIPTSGRSDDATYLRRVTLDLTGRLPSLDEIESFDADQRAERRQHLVDRLLDSEDFVEYWTFQFAKLLRIHTQPQDDRGALVYHTWLKEQVAQDVGYDRLARTVLTAIGDSHKIGPANFYRTVGGPREQAEFASELFMANRLRCANCHNHPLDQWTQDDYHGLAAIFAKVQSGKTVSLNENGQVIHPRTGENAVPRLPGQRFLTDEDDALKTFADWLTDRENPYFAKAIVNRLWKSLMGRGLVEPADDLRATNPATHPALLNELADEFVANGFKVKQTLRQIVFSDAYARSSATTDENEADDRFYSHSLLRPLEPEVLADAISDVLQVPEQYGEMPLGTRAVSLFDPTTESQSLDVLGRCSRQESCETSGVGSEAGGLPRKLHLFNGPLLNRRIAADSGRLSSLLKSGLTSEEVVDAFYLAALSRKPSARERDFWRLELDGDQAATDRRERLEDFVWSLLTCKEFVTNH